MLFVQLSLLFKSLNEIDWELRKPLVSNIISSENHPKYPFHGEVKEIINIYLGMRCRCTYHWMHTHSLRFGI